MLFRSKAKEENFPSPIIEDKPEDMIPVNRNETIVFGIPSRSKGKKRDKVDLNDDDQQIKTNHKLSFQEDWTLIIGFLWPALLIVALLMQC